ncbi:MAG: protein kinase [Gammaproteobacteria bacterium]
MKKQTFGESAACRNSVHPTAAKQPRHYPRLSAGNLKKDEFISFYINGWDETYDGSIGYKQERANGTEADNPSRPLPYDGIYTWGTPPNPNASERKVRYTEGQEDKKWMEERDANYLARIEREGSLQRLEPDMWRMRQASFALAIQQIQQNSLTNLDLNNIFHTEPQSGLSDRVLSGLRLSSEELKTIFLSLKSNTSVRTLQLKTDPALLSGVENELADLILARSNLVILPRPEDFPLVKIILVQRANAERERLEKERVQAEQALFKKALQEITQDSTEKLNLSDIRILTQPAPRALNAAEILQLLGVLKNNLSVIHLDLSNTNLNAAAIVTLCEILSSKMLVSINLTGTQFPAELKNSLQNALQGNKHLQQIIGFALPKKVEPEPPPPPNPLPTPSPFLQQTAYQIRYQDLEYGAELGRGSFGIVRRGRWQHMDVAIKELIMQQMDPQVLQNFEQEVAMMASLHHSNVIHLCGACLDPGHYSLVMEYMPKGSLYKVLHNSSEPLPWPQRWQIAYDVARGILHLHQHNPEILHRDLKSLNVLLNEHYVAKVSDFGLSKAKTETRSSTKTEAGNASCGTLLWSAPELFGFKPKPSKAADVYSFAMILWEIAARALPYEGVELEEVRAGVKSGDRLDIPEGTPPAFAALITRCWAQLAEKRPTIEEVVMEIEKNIPQGSTTTTTAPKPTLSAQIRKVEGLIEEGVALQCGMMRNIGQQVAINQVQAISPGSGSHVGPALNSLGVFASQSSASTPVVNSNSSSSSTTTSLPKMTQ